MIVEDKYQIKIFYSEEDECYIAIAPDLPYCSAYGATMEEALKEIQIAKKGWIESAKKVNLPLPVPLEKQDYCQDYYIDGINKGKGDYHTHAK
ncbi:MAG: type II toxin-antitoxin system HicB family antitoxin [Candidatus Magnetoovum sp. WYHC-5]|nr:type II toxin-antitoxin system HicB family antitoxin [Candidatus Magnetoovum sp. WYHC-5]